ncbi:30S ribosomal protein S8 [Candidatus Falkowbacteria bacterium]|nr:30S ribosomal protein S8 [Candidatus Falkowbacteria bacterium]
MDPISDMLTRIRNAVLVRHGEVMIPFSRIKFEIAKIMETERFIKGIEVLEKERKIKITLKYGADGSPVVRNLKRVSKPGKRVYAGKTELPKVLGGMGVAIVSTSQGLFTAEEAKKRGLGGEVLCEIY